MHSDTQIASFFFTDLDLCGVHNAKGLEKVKESGESVVVQFHRTL